MNNKLMEVLFSLKYENKVIYKHLCIFKNTKSDRIKNKHFSKILELVLEERGKIIFDGVVLLKYSHYQHLNTFTGDI